MKSSRGPREIPLAIPLAIPIPIALAIIVSALALLGASRASARPLYATRTGMACGRCHVDPAGGGVRAQTGFLYAWNGHTITPAEEREPVLDPRIADGLRFGADVRSVYLQSEDQLPSDRSSFFLMEATVHVAADLNDRLTLVYSNDQGAVAETYGLIRSLPLSASLKVGRFKPAFGLEVEDHSTFTRDSLGFGPNAYDTGAAVTFTPRNVQVDLALTNGRLGLPGFDDNDQKAVTGRAAWFRDWIGFGASGFFDTGRLNTGERGRTYRYGAFGQLHRGPVVLLAEYDRLTNDPDHGSSVDGEAGFVQGWYEIRPSISLTAKYDRFDPDLDLAETGRDRVSAGIESDLLPLLRLEAYARGTRIYGFDDEGRRRYGENHDVFDLIAMLYLSF
ncbi:MAG: hypothetical protein ACE15D_04025 [Candidatus Eisenbacteria bacterium]